MRSEGINPLVRAESLLSDPSGQGKSTEYAHHAVSRSLANSTQLNLKQDSSNFVSPRNTCNYTDIMGYKNIDISADVD